MVAPLSVVTYFVTFSVFISTLNMWSCVYTNKNVAEYSNLDVLFISIFFFLVLLVLFVLLVLVACSKLII